MTTSRRDFSTGLIGGLGLALAGVGVGASAAPGTLERLRGLGRARVGVANQPPFSALGLDGTLTGLAPTIAAAAMGRLGVPALEGVVATYGELIPGLQAGRWDFVAASLTISKARCGEVLFSDPLAFDGGAIVSLPGALPNPPKLVSQFVKDGVTVGVQAGGAHARVALAAGIDPANLKQFPNDVSILDALVAKRIQIGFASNSSIRHAYGQRRLAVDVTYPVEDDPPPGSSCAFRKADGDLHAAFQSELRAMKASGEYLTIARRFGFDTPPALIPVTAADLCARDT